MSRKAIASHKRRDKLFNKLDKDTRARADLADFLAEKAAEEDPTITRGALIEKVCMNWARRNGFKPKE